MRIREAITLRQSFRPCDRSCLGHPCPDGVIRFKEGMTDCPLIRLPLTGLEKCPLWIGAVSLPDEPDTECDNCPWYGVCPTEGKPNKPGCIDTAAQDYAADCDDEIVRYSCEHCEAYKVCTRCQICLTCMDFDTCDEREPGRYSCTKSEVPAAVPVPVEIVKPEEDVQKVKVSKCTYTIDEWRAEAVRRFGPDPMFWKFKCPTCGHIQCGDDFVKINARAVKPFDRETPMPVKDPKNVAYQECVGRYVGDMGGCSYAAYGLIHSDTTVTTSGGTVVHIFPFADRGV
jgi:hypothetical protein